MSFELFPVVQWFDNNGNPLSGGLISTFAAGTTTPQATFTDSTGGTPNANPVVLDAAGRAQIWFGAASYKLVLKTSAGVTLMTIDNITLDNLAATITSLTMTAALTMQQATAATALANQSSNVFSLQGNYWNGSASATDQWTFQDVLGAGTNPTSTLTLAHSGSSGTVSINMPQVAVSFGNVTAPAFIDSVGVPATAGQVRLSTADAINWRNVANSGNVGLTDPGVAAAGTGNLADNLKWSGGGFQGAAYVDQSAAPANSGVVRVGNNVAAVVARNAAGNGDVQAVLVDASNVTNLGGAAGAKVPGGLNGLTPGFQKFIAGGTFTIPTGVTGVVVTLFGGGGAGGGATAANVGSGGGSGGYAVKTLTGLTPGNTIAVTVGAGGTGVSGAAGNAGAASTIASGTQTITTVTANGGLGGGSQSSVPIGGAGGGAISTNGDINGAGAPGDTGFSTAAGVKGGSTMLGGAGTVVGGSTAGSAAVANTGSGGGGAGAGANNAGGNGAAGLVVFQWAQ